MKTTIFSKMVFACGLIAIAPCTIFSQNNNATDSKQPVHIKIIKNINGVETVIDTVIASDQVKTLDSGMGDDFETNLQLGKGMEIIIKNITDTIIDSSDSIVMKHLGKINDPEMAKVIKEMESNSNGKPMRKMVIINDDNEPTSNGNKKQSKSEVKIIIKKVDVQDPSASERKLFQKEQISSESNLNLKWINLFPNPSNGHFNLTFDLQEKGNTEVVIYDLAGKILYQEQLKDFNGSYHKEIDLTEGSKGVYFLKVLQGNKAILKKIVLQ